MERVQVKFPKDDPRARSRTKRSFKDECDIALIMERAKKGKAVPFASREAFCGDFDTAQDYFEVQKKKVALDEQFMKLPAEVRARFGHDAGKLIEFLCDDANAEEAVKLGILAPKELTAEQIAANKAAADKARRDALADDLKALGK